MAEGIDVSKWQGAINWANVKSAGKEFAVARSSIGMSTADPTFITNYKGMVDNNMIPGAYHLVAATSTGAQQASNWKKQLDAAGFDKGLLVLDVEGWAETTSNPPADTLAAVEYLCNWIVETYNRTPIIYTGYFWRDYLKQHLDNFGSKLWLAAYVTDPTPYIPKAWDSWKFWQYTSSGSVNGITGNVDLDKSAGTLYSLQRLAGWEWDELATKAEIDAVVGAQVDRAIQELTTVLDEDLGHLSVKLQNIQTAVQDSESTTLNAVVDLKAQLINGLNQILQTVNDDNVSTQTVLDELKKLVDTLHAHVCKRVDLHV